jgi:chemotaxis protein MotD
MTVSISPTLPGSTAARSTGQAATDSGDATFQEVLGSSTKHSGSRHAASHSHRPGENGSHRPARSNETNLDLLRGENEATEKTNGSKIDRFPPASAGAIRLNDDTGDSTDGQVSEALPGIAAHERLPLLMSLHEINRASGAAEIRHPGNNTDDEGMPAGRRVSVGRITDAERTSPKESTAPEPRQMASRNIDPAAIPVELSGEPDATPHANAGKSPPTDMIADAVRSNTATRDDHAVRAPMSERVTVVSAQSFPAPAMPGLDMNTSNIVSAIASDSGLHHASSSSALLPGPSHLIATVAHTLKIELHPAELGVVNAHMRLAGEQLSIELLPDTQEAYHRLSSDGDAIARALRDLGFDVAKVTILQPSIAVTPTPRSDAANSAMAAPDRDSSSFQSGQSGGNGSGPGNHQSGKGRDNDLLNSGRSSSTVRDRAGSGLFI